MLKYDFHIHTEYCGHAEGMTVEKIVRQAESLKLDCICITDHVFDNDGLKVIEQIRKDLAKAKPDIDVYVGAEVDVDYRTYDGSLVCDDVSSLDYVIAGLHFIPGEGVYPHTKEDCKLPEGIFLQRWESMLLGAVKNPKVNTLAHPGRLVAMCVDAINCWDYILATFDKAAKLSKQNNIFWEVNELDSKKIVVPLKDKWYEIDQVALNNGVSLIYGSDAHQVEAIAKMDFVNNELSNLPAGSLKDPSMLGLI